MVRVKLRVGDTEIISSAAVEVVGAVGSVQEEQRVQGLYLMCWIELGLPDYGEAST